ncbi:hypothetical protein [uncultured Prevotella sp.]|uniref:hypothetical protein n=1 Tax=uncultured Prevotella sp. TaxID=159272 RepID=UPI00265CDA23|nr:hypothetical protein [uncultured Prevotella sp.]
MSSCSDDDNSGTTQSGVNWTTNGGIKACDHLLFTADGDANVNDNGTQIGNGDQEFVFTGKQTIKKGTYILKGWVYIADGAELTIEPGTVIKGDKQTKASLIAERGGKLIAQGTATEPIVFTSEEAKGNRRPGDWGGIILCGKAKNNKSEMQIEGGPRTKHGGNDDADNSGVLSYVRIEFAGYPFQTDQEINGLTLGSVGSGTKIDHVQVSYTNDDSYEWFGGTVNCKYLVAYKGWDDDFDTDNGFSGKVQFGLSVRDSKIADVSQSNSFESDNNADGSNSEPHTSAVFSNMTLVGPMATDASFVNDASYINGGNYYPNNGSSLGKFQAAMHIRRDTHLNCFNSVAIGWPIGIIIDNEKGDTQGAATAGNLKLENIWLANVNAVGTDFNKIYVDGLYNYETKQVDESQPSFSSTFFKAQSGNKFYEAATGWFDTTGYIPTSGSPLLSAAAFTNSLLSGFDQVSYIGAFAVGDTWLDGWTNFDPQNTDY